MSDSRAIRGEIDRKDSLGSMPGDVSWMVAGHGIAHSVRSRPASRRAAVDIHGIQSWMALPTEHEEIDPRFEHHPGGHGSTPLSRFMRPGPYATRRGWRSGS